MATTTSCFASFLKKTIDRLYIIGNGNKLAFTLFLQADIKTFAADIDADNDLFHKLVLENVK